VTGLTDPVFFLPAGWNGVKGKDRKAILSAESALARVLLRALGHCPSDP